MQKSYVSKVLFNFVFTAMGFHVSLVEAGASPALLSVVGRSLGISCAAYDSSGGRSRPSTPVHAPAPVHAPDQAFRSLAEVFCQEGGKGLSFLEEQAQTGPVETDDPQLIPVRAPHYRFTVVLDL